MLERDWHLNILVTHGTMGKALFTTPDSNFILIILNQRSFPREWTSGVKCAEANPYAMQHISVKMNRTRTL